MRVGVFGGSFDPIHLGHLVLAESCREQAALDQILFVPCNMSPHKRDGAFGTDRQRMEMLALAIGGNRDFVASDIEIKRGGVSYTVETLAELSESRPDDEFFFLMGSDSLDSFATWKDPERILELALPIVVRRPGTEEVGLEVLKPLCTAERFELLSQLQVQSPLIEVSSTDIRSSAAQGKSTRYLVPPAIEKYIDSQKLYRD